MYSLSKTLCTHWSFHKHTPKHTNPLRSILIAKNSFIHILFHPSSQPLDPYSMMILKFNSSFFSSPAGGRRRHSPTSSSSRRGIVAAAAAAASAGKTFTLVLMTMTVMMPTTMLTIPVVVAAEGTRERALSGDGDCDPTTVLIEELIRRGCCDPNAVPFEELIRRGCDIVINPEVVLDPNIRPPQVVESPPTPPREPRERPGGGGDPRERPGGGGDPHFTTWSHEHFDFQGECDLMLVHNPTFKDGLGMDIYGRTKLHGTWSAFASAAVKIGDDVLEVHGADPPIINGITFHLDVEDGNEFAFPMSLGDFSMTVQQRGPHSRRHIIHLGDGERIFINNFKEFVDVEIESPRPQEFTGSVGLLGSYTTGTNLARDGRTVIEDPDAFGQEWQVRDTDPQLFHIVDGPQYPTKCTMPEKLSVAQGLLRAANKKISPEMAKKACAKARASVMANCVADVFGSDNLDMAGIYTGVEAATDTL
jgi:hypothetical protein